MVQLRWYKVSQTLRGSELDHTKKLQYRQIIDKTVRAQPVGPFGKPIEYHTPWGQVPPVPPIIQNWEWTEWMDVPEVWDVEVEE